MQETQENKKCFQARQKVRVVKYSQAIPWCPSWGLASANTRTLRSMLYHYIPDTAKKYGNHATKTLISS